MKTNRLNFVQLLAFCVLILGLAACDSQGSEEGTEVDFNRTENSVVIRTLSDADNLNALITTTATARQVIDEVQQYMLSVDPQSLKLIPQLANALPEIENIEDGPYAGGLKLTYEIHETATWDDGTPITGEDYIFTLKAALIPGASSVALQSYLTTVKDAQIAADDPKQVSVFLDKPYFLAREITGNGFPIYPKHIYDAEGHLDEISLTDLSNSEKAADLVANSEDIQAFVASFSGPEFTRDKIVGSNAYEFVKWVPNQEIVLRRKTDWWGDQLAEEFQSLRAYPDEIVFKPIGQAQTALAALKSEELDIVGNIPASTYFEIKDDPTVTDKYNLVIQDLMAYYLLWVNNRRPLLSEVNVRQALAHSINMDTLIQATFRGFGTRTSSPVEQSIDAYNSDITPTPFSPETAKTLLKEGGWEDTNNDGTVDKVIDGEKVELKIDYGYRAGSVLGRSIGLVIKNYAEAVGIGINLVEKDANAWVEAIKTGDYDTYAGGSETQPIWIPRQRWHSKSDDRSGFGTAYTDSLIERSEIIVDEAERNLIYKEIQQIIHDQMTVIFLMAPQNILAIHKRFEAELTRQNPNYIPDLVKIKDL